MVWSGRLKLTRPDYLNVCKHIYIYIYIYMCVCVCVCVWVWVDVGGGVRLKGRCEPNTETVGISGV